jgi:MFS family permease
MVAGPAIAISALLLTHLGPHTSIGLLLASYLIFGIGFGVVNAPITNTAMSGMPREQAGVAGAIASMGRQIGASLGVAITGSLIAGSRTGFISASHAAWAVLTGCGVAVFLLGLGSTGAWARRTADHTRELLLDTTKEAADGTLAPVR